MKTLLAVYGNPHLVLNDVIEIPSVDRKRYKIVGRTVKSIESSAIPHTEYTELELEPV